MTYEFPVTITQSAYDKIKLLLQSEPEDSMLRIKVSTSGCSGYQYKFSFDVVAHENDVILDQDGFYLLVDDKSMTMIEGSTIEYVEGEMESRFNIINPNVKSSCGCGKSFTV